MSFKKITLSLATLASLSLLVACSTKEQTTSTPQASTSSEVITSQVSESTTASATNATTVSTYKGQDEGDSITLVVTGNTGTWTEVEADGVQEVKKVTFEPENQKVIIGDDVKIYVAEENQIIIDDMDREVSDRIVLKK